MKKIFLLIMLLFFCSIFLISCKNNEKIEENISEITKIYFLGKNNNGDFKCSISVGERENPYKVDGIHYPTCDFSLVCLRSKIYLNEQVQVTIIINDVSHDLLLYYNPVNNTYINDLGFALNENDVVQLECENEVFTLYNISKDFKIDYKKALDISFEEFYEKLSVLFDKGKFLGECYLKILSNYNDNKLFWLFTVQTRNNESFNLILSVDSGNIIIQN